MRESSRRDNNVDMDMKYKFNAGEYSKMLGITTSALRKRRLAGKMNDEFIKKGSEYFYMSPKTDGPNKDSFTLNNSRSKHRRRNVPRSEVQYHKAHNGHQLQMANDIKQLARINRSLSEAGIAEIVPDIFEVAKQRRLERTKKQEEQTQKDMSSKYYGGWINCTTPKRHGLKDFRTPFKPVFEADKPEETTDEPTRKYY